MPGLLEYDCCVWYFRAMADIACRCWLQMHELNPFHSRLQGWVKETLTITGEIPA